mmetsp:Transcript_19757/g.51720  ORF Transcript_19757/g.51720 Transcript_19757/m.51720 type:complete len:90 (+) Transcript_19757:1155-1424(+)
MVSTSGEAATASSGTRGYSQKTLIDLESGVSDTVKSLGVVAENVCVAQRGETTATENRHTMEMQLGHAQKDLKAQEEDVDAARKNVTFQ